MLLEFSVTNFRSIKEKQTLSLLKTKKNELEDNFTTITLSTGKTLDVLNSAVIYGANASGKSNVVAALHDMVHIVLFSANYQANNKIPVVPFLLLPNAQNQVTEFELDFVANNGVRFVYGFSAKQEKIIDEWLYQYPNGSPQTLIERTGTNTWGAMTALKGNKKLWKDSTKDNSLFLSVAAQLNAVQILDIFAAILQIKGAVNGVPIDHTLDRVKHNKQQVLDFLSFADISIEDIDYQETEIPDSNNLVVENNEIKQQAVKHIQAKISFIHKSDNGSYAFDLSQESAGTQKLFNLTGFWLFILESGSTLVLDELQNSLHPKLVEYLVRMFHNPEINKNGAQLIFVTHETSLLDQNFFRKDQVWFCEKENNTTELFSLAEFKVRKGVDDLEKAYLSGRYGAVPYLR